MSTFQFVMKLMRKCTRKWFALKSTPQIKKYIVTITSGFLIESTSAKHFQPTHCLSLSSVLPNLSTIHKPVSSLNTICTLLFFSPPSVSYQPPSLATDFLNICHPFTYHLLNFPASAQLPHIQDLFPKLQKADDHPFTSLILLHLVLLHSENIILCNFFFFLQPLFFDGMPPSPFHSVFTSQCLAHCRSSINI